LRWGITRVNQQNISSTGLSSHQPINHRCPGLGISRALNWLTLYHRDIPIQFSHNLLSALEASEEVATFLPLPLPPSPPPNFPHHPLTILPQSDSTRRKSSDLHIAQLVHSELQRLQSRENELFSQLSSIPDTPGATAATEDTSGLLALSRAALAEKVADIKRRLEHIPSGKALGEGEDEEVKRARGEVVRCLKWKDRRPLDCWAEVQAFREVAGRRERGFVVGIVGK